MAARQKARSIRNGERRCRKDMGLRFAKERVGEPRDSSSLDRFVKTAGFSQFAAWFLVPGLQVPPFCAAWYPGRQDGAGSEPPGAGTAWRRPSWCASSMAEFTPSLVKMLAR